jgi:hypothetical protein
MWPDLKSSKLITQVYASNPRSSANAAGDSGYQTLVTIIVPAGTMGINSKLVLTVDYEYTSSANIKDFGIFWGADNFVGHSPTTTAGAQYKYEIQNYGSLAIQKTLNSGGNEGAVNSLHDTHTSDTTADVAITIKGKWRTSPIAGEFMAVTGYSLWHYPGS